MVLQIKFIRSLIAFVVTACNVSNMKYDVTFSVEGYKYLHHFLRYCSNFPCKHLTVLFLFTADRGTFDLIRTISHFP